MLTSQTIRDTAPKICFYTRGKTHTHTHTTNPPPAPDPMPGREPAGSARVPRPKTSCMSAYVFTLWAVTSVCVCGPYGLHLISARWGNGQLWATITATKHVTDHISSNTTLMRGRASASTKISYEIVCSRTKFHMKSQKRQPGSYEPVKRKPGSYEPVKRKTGFI